MKCVCLGTPAVTSSDNHSYRLTCASNNQGGEKAINMESFCVNVAVVLFSGQVIEVCFSV